MRNYFAFIFIFIFSLIASAKALTLSLNWKPEPEFGGFYAAQEEGIFKKEGLQVEIQPGGSGTPNIQMLSSGKVDFAVVSGDEILISRDRGSDVKAIFAVYQTAPYMIMTHAEKNFKTLGDVFNSAGVLALLKGLPYVDFLKKKYPNQKVKFVPYLGGVTNFLHDKNYSQQGFITSEPIAAERSGAKVKTFLLADEGYNPYVTVVAVRKQTMDSNPEMIKKITKAFRDGWQLYLKRPEKINTFMQKMNPSMDVATFKESSKIQEKFIETSDTKKKGLGSMTKERWLQLANQLKDLDLIKNVSIAEDVL